MRARVQLRGFRSKCDPGLVFQIEFRYVKGFLAKDLV